MTLEALDSDPVLDSLHTIFFKQLLIIYPFERGLLLVRLLIEFVFLLPPFFTFLLSIGIEILPKLMPELLPLGPSPVVPSGPVVGLVDIQSCLWVALPGLRLHESALLVR